MLLQYALQGSYVTLRSVQPDDAPFICEIRNDSQLNQYVHAVSPDVEAQKLWIQSQIERSGDYYFAVCPSGNEPVGLASIYDVNCERGTAEFGRWVSRGNALQNVESVVLAFDFAFETLGVDLIYMRTMMANTAVRSFWERFGAESQGEVLEMGLKLDKQLVSRASYYGGIRERCMRLLRR